MANTERIEDIIDEKAFKQLERLLSDLGLAQNEFVKLAGAVEQTNSQLAKATGFKELEKNIKELETSSKKMEEASRRTVDTAKRASKAENDVVEATKEKIRVSNQELNIINKAGTSLDQYIRIQVRLKAENSQLTKEQRDLNKQFQNGAISADKLSDRLTEISKRQTELKTASTQVNSVVKAYTRETNAAEGSSEQLSARLVRLRKEWDNLSESQRENADVGGMLFQEIDDLDTKLKELDGSTGRNQRNVGNYSSALSGLPGPLGAAISGLEGFSNSANDLTENLSGGEGVFSGFINGIKSATKAAIAFIATPLGAVLAGLGGTLLAAKGWFEYNKNISEATRLTRQLTGLEGNELKAFRAEVQATADTFGKDFKETIIATNAVAKQFGITQQEALDVVNKGFIAGADASGEFLEQLREYPTQLQAVGLSASETAAIITQNVQEGIYSDKGIDAIKEAGIRIRELTPATKEAIEGIGLSSREIQRGLESGALSMFDVIQQVSGKLNELPENSAAVGTAIADIFGGPGEDAGLAYLQTLQDIDLNLDNVVSGAGELGHAQQMQLEATEELNKAWATLFDATGGTFELLIANAKLFATDILIGVINGIIGVTNYFIDLYNEVTLFRGAIQFLKASFQTLFEFIAFSINRTIQAWKDFGRLFKAIITGDLQGVKDAFRDGFANQYDAIKDFGKETAQNYIDGFNETLRSGDIARVENLNDMSGPVASGSGGGDFDGGTTLSFRRLEAEIKGVERILDVNKKLEIDTKAGAERIAEWRERMAKQAADAEIAQAERALERQKEIDEAKRELYGEIAELAITLVNAQLERETNELKKQAEQIDINKQKELERINSTVTNEEEKAARIQILEAQTQAEKEELQRKEAEIQRRQAVFEKSVSIARIIGNTASGVTAALASVPPNIPLSIIIGAIGATQIAQVAATPIPQFATGVESSPEGPAIVGEKGKELRIEPGTGAMSLTPDKPSMTYLKKGTKIVPNHELKNYLFDQSISNSGNSNEGGKSWEVDKLIKSTETGFSKMQNAYNKRPEQRTVITKNGIHFMYNKGRNRREYLKRNLG